MSMGGGGGGQTQQSNQYSSVSPWAQPYVGSILGAAQKQVFNMDPQGQITGMAGYTPYGYQGAGMSAADQAAAQASVAGFTPLQQQAFQGASQLQTPGQFGSATNLASQAGYGALGAQRQSQGLMGQALGYGQEGNLYGGMAAGMAPQAQQYGQAGAGMGAQGLGYGALGAQAGLGYGQQATDPNAVQAYMNPYLQASLQPQLNAIQRQADIQSNQAASQATASGAFGGTRNALARNEAQRNALLAQQAAIGQGYNQAYNTAQQNMQNAASLGMQGAQAGLAGLNTGMQGQQLGLSGLQQASNLYGQGMQGAQAGLQGVTGALNAGQYGLSGLSQAGQQATNLANIGTQQLGAQQGILGLQNQYGTQQQQQQQNLINQAMQNYQTQGGYGMQQLQNLKNLISGFGTTDVTTTQEAAAPNTMSQIAGLAATGAGAYGAMGGFKAKGGVIKEKKFDVGGAVTSDLENMDDAHLMQEARTSPSAEIRRQAAQILAERRAAQGIEGAQSNLPAQGFAPGGIIGYGAQDADDGYAGGGMVAFERGGIAALHPMRFANEGLVPGFEDFTGGEPYRDTATRTPKVGTKELLNNLEAAKKAEAAKEALKGAKAATDASKGIGALSPWERLAGTGGTRAGLGAAGRFLSPLISAPAAVVSTGGEYLTNASGNTLKAMSPEMRQMLAEGDVGSDTSLAAAIMNAAGPEKVKAAPAKDEKATPSPAAKADKGAPTGGDSGADEDGIAAALSGKGGPAGIDAAFGSSPLGRLRAEAYKSMQEADLKSSKAQSDLEKQRQEIEANKDNKLWQALMMGGARAMGGQSRSALANIGEGIAGGLGDYAAAEKAERAEKKLLLQYQTALDQADFARKTHNFTALEQIQGRLDALKIAGMNASATKEAALTAAYQKNFGDLVTKLIVQRGLTEEEATQAAQRILATGDKTLASGVKVTKVPKS